MQDGVGGLFLFAGSEQAPLAGGYLFQALVYPPIIARRQGAEDQAKEGDDEYGGLA